MRPRRGYGEILHTSGTGKTNYAFTGESFDPQTGLTYLRARYYSAGQGRFISQDTWAGDARQPLSYNRWAYGYDNPVRFVDPSGYCGTTYNGDGNCYEIDRMKSRISGKYGLILTSTKDGRNATNDVENWDVDALRFLDDTLDLVSRRFENVVNWREVVERTGLHGRISGNILFKSFYSGLEIRRGSPEKQCLPGFTTCYYGKTHNGDLYTAYGQISNWTSGSMSGRNIILHELGHIIDQRSQTRFNNALVDNAYTRALLAEMQCNTSLNNAINKR